MAKLEHIYKFQNFIVTNCQIYAPRLRDTVCPKVENARHDIGILLRSNSSYLQYVLRWTGTFLPPIIPVKVNIILPFFIYDCIFLTINVFTTPIE